MRDRKNPETRPLSRKSRSLTGAVAALVMAVSGCQGGWNPEARRGVGDHWVRVEIHSYRLAPDGGIDEIVRPIAVRVDATNGAGEPLEADDFAKMTNWSAVGQTPWKLELSQPPDAPHRGIGVSIRYEIQRFPDDQHITTTCNFFVNGVEDLRNAQASQGFKGVCMYRTGF